MKLWMTLALFPMAVIGTGLLAAMTVSLLRAGWDIGEDLMDWLRDYYRRWRR